MNYRTVEILNEKGSLTTGTEIIPITVKDIISRIMLSWWVSPVAHGMNSYPHSDIEKIELIDGSDVLFSMNGGQCQALNIYDRKCPTMNLGYHGTGVPEFSTYGLDFGRFLHDPLLAFDPTKFGNPQLKITYNYRVRDTAATAGNLEVWAECFDEKVISPIGFLMSKNVFSRTPPAAGFYTVDLPTDYPYRKLLLQGYLAKFYPWYVVDKARLDEDNLKRVPFDWDDLEDYYRMMKGSWSPVEECIVGVIDADNYFYTTPTDYHPALTLLAQSNNYLHSPFALGGVFLPVSNAGMPQFEGHIMGYLPNHCFEFPLGDPQDIDDWYDVTKVGTLTLRLEAGTAAASGSVAVILQQLRRY